MRIGQALLLAASLAPIDAFVIVPSVNSRPTARARTANSELALVPISKFRDQFTFLDKDDTHRCNIDKDGVLADGDDVYTLSIVEESDMPDTATFIIETFGADAIALSNDLSTLERALLQPSVGLVNAYSGIIAYAEVFAGITSRTKDRNLDISRPVLTGESREEKLKEAERSSLILVLGKPQAGSDWHVDVIASVELRLQPTDAKIPFSFPGLDRAERGLAKILKISDNKARDLQPYLSNLCVSESYRRKSLGKSLVRCVEDIAKDVWDFEKMYLHVDLDNTAALKLYENEGYRDVGKRWRPFWAGKAADIGYFMKKLDAK